MANAIRQFTVLALMLCTAGYGIARFPNVCTFPGSDSSELVCTTGNQSTCNSVAGDRGNTSTESATNHLVSRPLDNVSVPSGTMSNELKKSSEDINPPIPPVNSNNRSLSSVGMPIPAEPEAFTGSDDSDKPEKTSNTEKNDNKSGQSAKIDSPKTETIIVKKAETSSDDLAKQEAAGIEPIPGDDIPEGNAVEASLNDKSVAPQESEKKTDSEKNDAEPSASHNIDKDSSLETETEPEPKSEFDTNLDDTNLDDTNDDLDGIAPVGAALPGLEPLDTPSQTEKTNEEALTESGETDIVNASDVADSTSELPDISGGDDLKMETWNNDPEAAISTDLAADANKPDEKASETETVGLLAGIEPVGDLPADPAASGSLGKPESEYAEEANTIQSEELSVNSTGSEAPDNSGIASLQDSQPNNVNQPDNVKQPDNVDSSDPDSRKIRNLPPPPSPYQPTQPVSISQFEPSVPGAIVLPSYSENANGELVLNETPKGFEMRPETESRLADSSGAASENGSNMSNEPTAVVLSKPISDPGWDASSETAVHTNETGLPTPEYGDSSNTVSVSMEKNELGTDQIPPTLPNDFDASQLQSASDAPETGVSEIKTENVFKGESGILPPVPLIVKPLNVNQNSIAKTNGPKAEELKTEEPKADEPKAEEPKADEPKADEPKAEEPKAEEPKAEEPKTEEPKAEEPKTEEPKAEEPKAEEPKAEEPKAEEPKAEEPKAEEPKAEEPKAEEPKAEEPKTEEPKTDEPETDEPIAEEPIAEELQADEPVAEDSAIVPFDTETSEIPNDADLWNADPFGEQKPESDNNGTIESESESAGSQGDNPLAANGSGYQWRGQSSPNYSVTNRSRKIDTPLQEGSVRIARKPISNGNSSSDGGFLPAGMGISAWQDAPPVDRLPRAVNSREPVYRAREEDYRRINSIADQFDRAD